MDVFKKQADVKPRRDDKKRKKSSGEVGSEEEEPKPKKKLTVQELFAKKTVGEAFDDAQERYYRRKALGISGFRSGLG